MGGFYWVDPKALRNQVTNAEATAEALSPKAQRTSATGQPAAPAWQPCAMASQPSAISWRPVALAQRIGLFLIGAHASVREPSETASTGCTQHAPGERS